MLSYKEFVVIKRQVFTVMFKHQALKQIFNFSLNPNTDRENKTVSRDK